MEWSRDGKTPLPRVYDPPCRRCPKVPQTFIDLKQREGGKVTPADAVEPDVRHRETVEHFLQCAAVGHFPADDWVRRNARLIRPIWKVAEDAPMRDLTAAFTTLLRKLRHA